jgi:hypothetical protein
MQSYKDAAKKMTRERSLGTNPTKVQCVTNLSVNMKNKSMIAASKLLQTNKSLKQPISPLIRCNTSHHFRTLNQTIQDVS